MISRGVNIESTLESCPREPGDSDQVRKEGGKTMECESNREGAVVELDWGGTDQRKKKKNQQKLAKVLKRCAIKENDRFLTCALKETPSPPVRRPRT